MLDRGLAAVTVWDSANDNKHKIVDGIVCILFKQSDGRRQRRLNTLGSHNVISGYRHDSTGCHKPDVVVIVRRDSQGM